MNYKLIDIDFPNVVEEDSIDSYKEEEFPLDSRWSMPIIHYTCYRAFQLDETDTMNGQRANEHLGYFNTWSQL